MANECGTKGRGICNLDQGFAGALREARILSLLLWHLALKASYSNLPHVVSVRKRIKVSWKTFANIQKLYKWERKTRAARTCYIVIFDLIKGFHLPLMCILFLLYS